MTTLPALHAALRAVGVVALCSLGAAALAQTPPRLAVIGFELIEEHPDASQADALQLRLAAIHAQLQQGLARAGLYEVVDTAPAQDLIAALRERHAFVYRCNDCLGEVAQRLGTRLVAVGWVQKVSNLILNVNVSVRDAATDEEVLSKSVDLRGNTDETWARGIRFMLRDWAERRARNPRYGQ